jgi:hypothetical protein
MGTRNAVLVLAALLSSGLVIQPEASGASTRRRGGRVSQYTPGPAAVADAPGLSANGPSPSRTAKLRERSSFALVRISSSVGTRRW